MNRYLIITLFFSLFGANAQVTPNPKIKKKSTSDVYINKLEITESQTIVHMQYVSKSPQDQLKDFFNNNPEEKEKFSQMQPMMRQMLLQQMMLTAGSSTISFQPGSFLKTSDGKKCKFLKAENIPTAPNRQDTEPGKKYFFKVYFEKLPKGYESIDLIENDLDANDGMTYWNFEGISIINPAEGKSSNTLAEDKKMVEFKDFRLFGKVLNIENEKPVASKIVCYNAKTNKKIDSMVTSKSGYYEFILNDEDIYYNVSAVGFNTLEESINLEVLKSKGSFEKNIYLEAPKNEKTPVVSEKVVEKPKKDLGEVIDKSAFKLDKVYFDLGQAQVLPDSYEQLDGLAEYLLENPVIKIQVEGHTDKIGDPKANKKLSLERAFNVRQYLIDKGIAGERIKFVGYGDTKPVSTKNDEASGKLNRRVEYKIFEGL